MRTLVLAVSLCTLAALGCKKKDDPQKPAAGKPAAAPAAPAAPVPTAAAPTAAPLTPPPPTKEAAPIIEKIYASFNAGKLDEALTAYAEDHEEVDAGHADRQLKGRAPLKQRFEALRAAFPDLQYKVKRVFDGGNVWISQVVAHGTHKGDFLGHKATGKKVGWEFARKSWAKDGVIRKSYIYRNPGAPLSQIGAVPGTPPHPLPEWPAKTEVIKGEGSADHVGTVRTIYDAVSKGDHATIEKHSTKDITIMDHAEGKAAKGAEENRKGLDLFRKAFPDLRVELEDAVAIGEWVVARGILKGTHKGDLGPIKPTGRRVSLHYLDAARFTGAQVSYVESYMDQTELMEQLGVGGAATATAEPPLPE